MDDHPASSWEVTGCDDFVIVGDELASFLESSSCLIQRQFARPFAHIGPKMPVFDSRFQHDLYPRNAATPSEYSRSVRILPAALKSPFIGMRAYSQWATNSAVVNRINLLARLLSFKRNRLILQILATSILTR